MNGEDNSIGIWFAPDYDPDDFDEQDHEGLDECGNPLFECPAFMVGGRLHCPIAGTEDCDWECDR